jgi:hypothetical protein
MIRKNNTVGYIIGTSYECIFSYKLNLGYLLDLKNY